jgi:hypothetical protein
LTPVELHQFPFGPHPGTEIQFPGELPVKASISPALLLSTEIVFLQMHLFAILYLAPHLVAVV